VVPIVEGEPNAPLPEFRSRTTCRALLVVAASMSPSPSKSARVKHDFNGPLE